VGLVLACFCFFFTTLAFSQADPTYRQAGDIKQGEVMILPLPSDLPRYPDGLYKAYFNNTEMPIFEYGGRKYILIAADFRQKPGLYPLRVKQGSRLLYETQLSVARSNFQIGRLNYNYKFATLSRTVQDSINEANKPFYEAICQGAEVQLWRSPFGNPLDTMIIKSPFGRVRIYKNDTTPHKGVDLYGLPGDPVYAISEGSILWGEDRALYAEGKIVVLDHGQGVVSMYMHLSRVKVKTGDSVKKGQVLGEVGATGADVTGSHLHFTVKVGEAFVDPLKFIKVFNDLSR
jgi:murein DD-endopeptidase MepM/ murein hydrolase activator NlpD